MFEYDKICEFEKPYIIAEIGSNHMATLGVTTMSAESKTEPGGYYSYPQTLEQFHVSDERKAVEVERDLKKLGREPVWKDWDQSFDFKR